MIVAVDFDGTCVTHEFPGVGRDIGAAPVLKRLVKEGHQLILWTMRSDVKDPKSLVPEINPIAGDHLTAAINWFKVNEIPLFGIQRNPTQDDWTSSPKAYANIYIDDAGVGCPLINNGVDRPYADWEAIEKLIF